MSFYADNLRNVADDCEAGRGVIEPVGDDDLDDEQEEETVIMTARPHPVHRSPVEILPRSGECTKQQR